MQDERLSHPTNEAQVGTLPTNGHTGWERTNPDRRSGLLAPRTPATTTILDGLSFTISAIFYSFQIH